MSQVLDQYKALSSSSNDQASTTFTAIRIALVANQLDTGCRKTLAQLILDDLRAALLDNTVSRLSANDATQALGTLKGLGGTPEVASILGTSPNLSCLLNLSTKIDDSVQNDALRCIANTVLLDEPARVTFVGAEVGGSNICIDLLRKPSMEHVFLASRILFLCTASAAAAAPFIQWLVEHKLPNVPGSGTAIDIIGSKLDDLTESIKEGKTAAKDTTMDLLKLIFNLCVHYPKLVDCEVQSPEVTISDSDNKVMGDYWSTRLDSLLPPLLRAFHVNSSSSNPLETPLPHIVHSLIVIPVVPANRNIWFGKQSPALTLPDSASSSSASSSSTHSSKSRLIERASCILSAGRRSLLRPSGSRPETPVLQDSALRAYELLDATLAHFMPGDIPSDDPSIRSRLPDGEPLDDLVSPLVILITRFCLGDEDAKIRIRNWFIPHNLDRSNPLESRPDLLGRCLRLLQSVYHTRLKRVCGEMFFAMCDCDATTLSGYLGYGNVAGFLFQKGVVSPPARSTTSGPLTTTAGGLPINPITGTIEKEHEPIDMTDEEKEQETEKLFVLFDRLEKTGALPPSQNPIRKAIQGGKLR
ncbi:guanine nucleotide exchange factor [Boletus edulis]|nr:guanine nucleotide exchange factor [Boletus edulis]